MNKRFNRTDYLFILTLIAGIIVISVFLFTHPYLYDEAFYASVPYRLANGDNLVQHEWHLTQFSSLFSYVPVRIWLALKGSADGIIVFLRCVYFIIHTASTVLVYRFFRKYEKWAIVAAMIFFTQVPYRVFGISYNSMYALFVLLFTLCLLSVYKKPSICLYIISGICYACCCVCNPLYCLAFVLYLIARAVWKKREIFRSFVVKIKILFVPKNKKNIHEKQNKKLKQINAFPNMESYNCFFCKEAVIFSLLGILIVAVVAVVFFFATGGKINSLFENIPNLLESSEYSLVSSSLLSKLKLTYFYFNKISFNLFFLLPLLYIILLFDYKRNNDYHRCFYLMISIIIGIISILGILRDVNENRSFETWFFSLPFFIFSSFCYILTDRKNTVMFYCMWLPCMIAAIFQFLSANTYLSSLGFVIAISNIAGVFFCRDLFREISFNLNSKTNNKLFKIGKLLMYTGICLQFLFHVFFLQYEQIPGKDVTKATSGPYSGLLMTEEQYTNYTKIISDMDLIEKRNIENSPLLIVSFKNWTYLCNQSPIATYTTWYNGSLHKKHLITYYKENPDKTPRYIYIDPYDCYNKYDSNMLYSNIDIISDMFEVTIEKLTNGVLLTVKNVNFEPKK